MKYLILSLFSLLITGHIYAQVSNDISTTNKKRLIDKIEIFGGPSLCLNYGNKFVENYKDENVTNKRQLKIEYIIGVGVYHPIRDRFDLNIQFQYEKKGTKNELSTPLFDGSRVIYNSEYDYHYLTLLAVPQYSIGEKRKFLIGLGGYLSQIKEVDGYDKIHVLKDNYIEESYFKGREFQDLRPDGTANSSSWQPGLTGIQKYDYGVSISLSYNIPIASNQNITIRLIDNFGFQNINKNNSYNLDEKNHSITLSLCYQFKLPPKNPNL